MAIKRKGFGKAGNFYVNREGTEAYDQQWRPIDIIKNVHGYMILDIYNPNKPPIHIARLVYKAFSQDNYVAKHSNLEYIDGDFENCNITNIKRKSSGVVNTNDTVKERYWRLWHREEATNRLTKDRYLLTLAFARDRLRRMVKEKCIGENVPENCHNHVRKLYVEGLEIRDIAILCQTRQSNIWEIVR